jgi:hypothetical protein
MGLQQLPSVLRFTRRVLEDLLQGRSVLILIPLGIATEELWSQIEEDLRQRGSRARWLDPEDLPNSGPELHRLWHWIKSPGELIPPQDWGDLLCRPDWPEALRIRGLERCRPEEQIRWAQIISSWAEARKGMSTPPPGPRSLWAVMPATLPLEHVPSNDVFLQVHQWWGFPSNLELRWLCREQSLSDPTEALWVEHISAGLAGSDPSLLLHLQEVVFDSFETICRRLSEIAEQRGWTAEECAEWIELVGSGARPAYPETIPPSLYPIWARGALMWTPEYGLELHPAVLARAGDLPSLQRRLVRAQASLVWPILVEIRQALRKQLGIQESAQDQLEWKDLAACAAGTSFETEANQVRHIRNNLAHLRPLSWPQFRFLWSLYQRLAGP